MMFRCASTAALSVLLSLVLISPTWSQPEGQAGWKVTQETLANGLTVIILEEPRAPVVTVQVWYQVGSRNERLGITGISHLLEHLMFRGTPRYGQGEFSRLIQERGGQHNAFTMEDYTVYFENAASRHLDLLLELEADRMANLVIDETGFAAERKIVMEERRLRTADEPAADLWEQVKAAAYTAHPYGWPVVGWMHDLDTMTLDDVKRYRQTFYSPNNAILVVAGDVVTRELRPKILATFGKVPTVPPPPPMTAREPPQRGERRVMLRRPASLPVYVAAYHVPNLNSEDSFALSILSVILGGGRSARLQKTLVEEKAVVLAADASYDRTSKDPTLFTLSMRIAPEKTWNEAEAALIAEIEKLKTDRVTSQELERAKNLVESHFIYGQDSLFFRALQLGQYSSLGDWSQIQQVVPGIRAVSPEDVRRVTQRYLRADNQTVGVLIPTEILRQERPALDLSRSSVH